MATTEWVVEVVEATETATTAAATTMMVATTTTGMVTSTDLWMAVTSPIPAVGGEEGAGAGATIIITPG